MLLLIEKKILQNSVAFSGNFVCAAKSRKLNIFQISFKKHISRMSFFYAKAFTVNDLLKVRLRQKISLVEGNLVLCKNFEI